MINQVPEQIEPPIVPPATHTTVIVREPQTIPDDHFIFALFVTLCCCLPFGIVSLVKSSNVKSLFNAGDVAGAEVASQGARKWAKIALISGIIFNLIWIIAVVVYFVVFATAVTMAISSDGWE